MITAEEHQRMVDRMELRSKLGRNYQQFLDHFAGLALPHRLEALRNMKFAKPVDWEDYCSSAAKESYDIAEAMLKEREARK